MTPEKAIEILEDQARQNELFAEQVMAMGHDDLDGFRKIFDYRKSIATALRMGINAIERCEKHNGRRE